MAPSDHLRMANPDRRSRPRRQGRAPGRDRRHIGRSYFPNQVNNVLGFPFIFRGALDVRATAINDGDGRSPRQRRSPSSPASRCRKRSRSPMAARPRASGRDYIIPAPFDPRLMEVVPAAVAQAAMDSGVARHPILDMEAYVHSLKARLNPTTSILQLAYEGARKQPKRIVFAEAEEEVVLRAAIAFREAGLGTPVLVGRDEVPDKLRALGVEDPESFELHNSRNSPLIERMVGYAVPAAPAPRLSAPRGRGDGQSGSQHLRRAAAGAGRGDAMLTGVTRPYAQTLRQIMRVIDPAGRPAAIRHPRAWSGAATPCSWPTPPSTNARAANELADIAQQTAEVARRMGQEPRVAFLSYSTFGNPGGNWLNTIRDAVGILDQARRHL
jgi:malate dehydrogenase (oxaloacetate-decarboxylating)(NADP+)